MNSRSLKQVRQRVQASIDKKPIKGGHDEEGDVGTRSPDVGNVEYAADVSPDHWSSGENDPEMPPTAKKRCRDDWRTYRYQKMSAAEQEEEDRWYGKSKWSKPSAEGGSDTTVTKGSAAATAVDLPETCQTNAEESGNLEPSPRNGTPSPSHGKGDAATSTKKAAGEGRETEGAGCTTDTHVDNADTNNADLGEEDKIPEEGPQRVLMLRELVTR